MKASVKLVAPVILGMVMGLPSTVNAENTGQPRLSRPPFSAMERDSSIFQRFVGKTWAESETEIRSLLSPGDIIRVGDIGSAWTFDFRSNRLSISLQNGVIQSIAWG